MEHGILYSGEKTYGEGTGAPSATTADLAVVTEEVECGLVAKRDVDDAVVGEGAHGVKGSGFLATAHSASGDEETSVLAPEGTSLPLTTWCCQQSSDSPIIALPYQ